MSKETVSSIYTLDTIVFRYLKLKANDEITSFEIIYMECIKVDSKFFFFATATPEHTANGITWPPQEVHLGHHSASYLVTPFSCVPVQGLHPQVKVKLNPKALLLNQTDL